MLQFGLSEEPRGCQRSLKRVRQTSPVPESNPAHFGGHFGGASKAAYAFDGLASAGSLAVRCSAWARASSKDDTGGRGEALDVERGRAKSRRGRVEVEKRSGPRRGWFRGCQKDCSKRKQERRASESLMKKEYNNSGRRSTAAHRKEREQRSRAELPLRLRESLKPQLGWLQRKLF